MLVDGYVTDESGTGVVHSAPAFGEVSVTCSHSKIDVFLLYVFFYIYICGIKLFVFVSASACGAKYFLKFYFCAGRLQSLFGQWNLAERGQNTLSSGSKWKIHR